MDDQTVRALDAVNRRFYERHGAEFSATRGAPWPGWRRACDAALRTAPEAPRRSAPARVLDLGCGNARFAFALQDAAAAAGRGIEYFGLDRSLRLLEHARAALGERFSHSWTLARWDVLEPGTIPAALAAAPAASSREPPAPPDGFDLVAVFGLLHHVPGSGHRRRLVREAFDAIRPGGTLALAAWQFDDDERFLERCVPPEEARRRGFLASASGPLEGGDRLLRWGGSESEALRYCHHTSPEELAALLAGLPARIETFRSDGLSGRLNLYALARRRR